jgi:hypothetical protein
MHKVTDQISLNGISDSPARKEVVDLYLFTPIHLLAESLLHPNLRKALIDLFDYSVRNKVRLGRCDILSWLKTKTDFHQTKAIETILKTTPLGNPAWWLFNGSSSKIASENLLKDLELYTSKLNATEPRSLQALIQKFIQDNPKYGNADAVAKTLNRSPADVLAEWQPQWCTFQSGLTDPSCLLGKLASQLILLQKAVAPLKTKDGDKYPIYQPHPYFYEVALSKLLVGTCLVETDVWQEMISLYHSKSYTNFLAFAPLFLQAFTEFQPSLNTLGVIFGKFSKTGTFMSDATKEGRVIKWETLGLTIGKCCLGTERLAPVTLRSDIDNETALDSTLHSREKMCGDTQDLSETPIVGSDIGWFVVSAKLLQSRWDLTFSDLIETVISDKIKFNEFPNVKRETFVFPTSRSLSWLDYWSKRQMKKISALTLSGTSCSLEEVCEQSQVKDAGDRAERRLPTSTLLTNAYCPSQNLPQLKLKKVSPSAPASITESNIKRCGRSVCDEMKLGNTESIEPETKGLGLEQTSFCLGSSSAASISRERASMLGRRLLKGEPKGCHHAPPQDAESHKSSGTIDLIVRCAERAVQTNVVGGNSVNRESGYNHGQKPKRCQLRRRSLPYDNYQRPADVSIPELFIAEPFKEDKHKKNIVRRLRHLRLKELKELERLRLNPLKSLSDDQLLELIKQYEVEFKEIEILQLKNHEKQIRKGQFDEAHAELIYRRLGIEFPHLVGLKNTTQVKDSLIDIDEKPLNFRFFLGDEEAAAIAKWKELEDDDDYPVTQAVRSVWIAMTVIHIALHWKREGIDYDFKNMWDYDEFQQFPLMDERNNRVLALIPYIYWTYVLKEPDNFRVKLPNMGTLLFLPTARISHFEDYDWGLPDKLLNERKKIELDKIHKLIEEDLNLNNFEEEDQSKPKLKSYLPEPLEDTKVSKLSLCELSAWHVEAILKCAEHRFELRYNSDIHPDKTAYIRLYVKIGVESLLNRLGNENLISFVTNLTSQARELGVEEVKKVFNTKYEEIRLWYLKFRDEFAAKWKIMGGEWSSFLEIEDVETVDVQSC